MPIFKRKSEKSSKSHKTPPPQRGSQNQLSNGNFKDATRNAYSEQIPTSSNYVGGVENVSSGARPKTLLLPLHQQTTPVDPGDLGFTRLKAETPLQTSSRLSKTLCEVLHDKDALPYLIQFMDSLNKQHLIKFWLDAESFQASAWTRIRSHSHQAVSSSLVRQRQKANISTPQDTQAKPSDNDLSSNNPNHTECTELETFPTCLDATSCQNETTSATVQTHLQRKPAPHFQTGTCATADNSKLSKDNSNAFAIDDTSPTRASANVSKTFDIVNINANSPGHSSCVNRTGENDTTTIMADNLPHGAISLNTQNTSDTRAGSSVLVNVSKEDSFGEKLRKSIERDAVSIYSKYISLDATHPIGINEELRNQTISKICSEDKQVDPQCFQACQEFIVDVLEKDYFQNFLSSEFHCKHQIDILTQTGGKVYLADILYNESAFFYFMEYMEQEGASTLLQCWMAMDNFQQHLVSQQGQYDGLQAQNDAMVLYDKYFSLQATQPIGFDDKVRMEVEMAICREDGPLPDCFALPMKIVLQTLDKVYFTSFLQNDIYYRYLSELISTIQNHYVIPSSRRKRAGSDASSEHSAGSQSTESGSVTSKNTLLAAPGSMPHFKKAINKLEDDLRIDNMLLNPDALWKRSQSGNMSFGKVNDMGQFVSEFDREPEQEKKEKSTDWTLR